MKIERLIGERFKEKPSDCVIDSHGLMVRAGYIKPISNGIFAQHPPLIRINKKIENIISTEMEKIDAQQVSTPVIQPVSILEQSNRAKLLGKDVAKFNDVNKIPMMVASSHQEGCIQLTKEFGNSYNKYPYMVYETQTKFKDDIRPRGGLISSREALVSDGCSFHTDIDDMNIQYNKICDSLEKIFLKTGLDNVKKVKCNSGIMGDKIAHQFIITSDIGEQTIACCDKCGYTENIDCAVPVVKNITDDKSEERKLLVTDNCHTMDEICDFLDIKLEKTCKTVVYQKNSDDKFVVVFLRGDMDVNQQQLSTIVGDKLNAGIIDMDTGLCVGCIGPYQLDDKFIKFYDKSLEGCNNICCGGNVDDRHYVGIDMARDCPGVEYVNFAEIKDGEICPSCGEGKVNFIKGVELAKTIQLGDKYTKSMDMQYLDKDGKPQHPLMTEYSIDIGRLVAAICEVSHDDYGPIWPMSIAPWQVHLCCVRSDDTQAKELADNLYQQMQNADIQVIYDDREIRPGAMFSDADLIGSPIRVVVSPRNLKENCCEVATRTKSFNEKIDIDKTFDKVKDLILTLNI